LTAAVTAHALSSSVAVLAKGAFAGGTTLASGGGMNMPNSRQVQVQRTDSPDDVGSGTIAEWVVRRPELRHGIR